MYRIYHFVIFNALKIYAVATLFISLFYKNDEKLLKILKIPELNYSQILIPHSINGSAQIEILTRFKAC